MAAPLDPVRVAEAVKFLDRDFNQASTEKGRCEDRAWDICKFAFTMHSGVITLSLAAYQYSLEHKVKYVPVAQALLALGLVMGLLLMFMLVKNRVYFVRPTRYLNEHRKHFLELQPVGFGNTTNYYTDPNHPRHWATGSVQVWIIRFTALLNGVVGAGLVFLLCGQVLVAIVALGGIVGAQYLWARQSLMSLDKP